MEHAVVYTEYPPVSCLQPFIDCYWILRADNLPEKSYTRRVMPDICADILFNLGEDIAVFNRQHHLLRNEKAYFVGSMTTFQDSFLRPGTHLLGIRFKPFGLTALLGFSLHGTANCIEEVNRRDFSLDTRYLYTHHAPISQALLRKKLDAFLAEKINGQYNREENDLIGTVLRLNGQVSVEQLAGRYHISERQLERKFQARVGITIKDVI
jgi:AraC-like DNA-binding protein